MPKGIQIAIGAIAIIALIAWYGLTNVERYQYYQTLEEFREGGNPDHNARIHGYVVLNSIERYLEEKRIVFAIQSEPPMKVGPAEDTLTIHYATLETPDMFQDGAEVVVEGKLLSTGENAVFEASNVLAKCPSKFEPKKTEPAPF